MRTVKKLSLPSQSLNYQSLAKKYKYLKGLPIGSYDDAKPTVLIGLNNINLCTPIWRFDNIDLPYNYGMAYKRLTGLEKSIAKNKDLLSFFQKTIAEYLDKKCISKIDTTIKCGIYLYFRFSIGINQKRQE